MLLWSVQAKGHLKIYYILVNERVWEHVCCLVNYEWYPNVFVGKHWPLTPRNTNVIYDMILYLITAIVLTPGDSSTVQIYT